MVFNNKMTAPWSGEGGTPKDDRIIASVVTTVTSEALSIDSAPRRCPLASLEKRVEATGNADSEQQGRGLHARASASTKQKKLLKIERNSQLPREFDMAPQGSRVPTKHLYKAYI